MLPTVRPPPLPAVAQVRVWLWGTVSLTVMHLGHKKEKALLSTQLTASRHRAAWCSQVLLKKRPIVPFRGSPPPGVYEVKKNSEVTVTEQHTMGE